MRLEKEAVATRETLVGTNGNSPARLNPNFVERYKERMRKGGENGEKRAD